MTRRLALALALLAAAPAFADAPDARPRAESGDNMLRIPGLPPIPMPPGARVFGPGEDGLRDLPPIPRPRAAEPRLPPAARPDQPKPAPKLPAAAIRKNLLDELFKRLAEARDLDEAKGIESAIERVWLRSGSDTADLLMTRALTAWQGNDFAIARGLLDRIVALEPQWAEAWNKRATLRFLTDDPKGAQSDAERALALEPRHYGALTGLSVIFRENGDKTRALDALRKALALAPQRKDLAVDVEKLRIDVEGQDI